MLDRLLENWDGFSRRYPDRSRLQDRIGPWTWAEVKRSLQCALAVEATNVAEYIATLPSQILTSKDCPNVRPISEYTWIEWEQDPAVANATPTDRNSLFSIDSDAAFRGALLVSTEEDSRIVVELFAFRETRKRELVFSGMYTWDCDKEGKPLDMFNPSKELQDCANFEQAKTGAAERFAEEVRLAFTVPGLTLSFMHCKNVELRKRETPVRKRPHTHGKRKRPFVKSYTLAIEPMKQTLRTEGQIEKTGLKQALHICRGHFKDYSKGKGLFGRTKGLFWWDMHARGNAEVGIIDKDYKVLRPAGTTP